MVALPALITALLRSPWAMTALAVIVPVLARMLFQRLRAPTPLPGKLQPSGEVELTNVDLGDDPETLRDMCRAYRAGGIWILTAGQLVQLRPPDGTPGGLEVDALVVAKASFLAALNELSAERVTDATLSRMVPMLSVGPAFALLTKTGCMPIFQQHRFVVALGSSDGVPSLRVLTTGFVGTPDGENRTKFLLAMASPDLRATPKEKEAPVTIRYDVLPAKRARIEEELERAAPRWRQAWL
jgi:hypothetical protein